MAANSAMTPGGQVKGSRLHGHFLFRDSVCSVRVSGSFDRAAIGQYTKPRQGDYRVFRSATYVAAKWLSARGYRDSNPRSPHEKNLRFFACVSAPKRDLTPNVKEGIGIACRIGGGTGSRSEPIGTPTPGRFRGDIKSGTAHFAGVPVARRFTAG